MEVNDAIDSALARQASYNTLISCCDQEQEGVDGRQCQLQLGAVPSIQNKHLSTTSST